MVTPKLLETLLLLLSTLSKRLLNTKHPIYGEKTCLTKWILTMNSKENSKALLLKERKMKPVVLED